MRPLRISTRLTLGLGVVGLAIFGAYGVYQAAVERAHLEQSIGREMELVAKSVQVGVENALRDHQFEDVQETLERLEAIDPRIDILVFDRDAAFRAGSGDPSNKRELIDAMARDALSATRMTLAWQPPNDPKEIVASVPLRDDDGTLQGSLIVRRPLRDLEEALARARRDTAVAATVLVIMMAVVGYWLSVVVVRRPLSLLIAAIQRLRLEGTAEPVLATAGAEIAELVREFNEMLSDLNRTRSRLDHESESRLRLEAGLRRVDKLVTVGQLSAGLAHEIGSPLQVLGGRASALLSKADDAAAVRKNAGIIVSECDRIARIVEQLLMFTRRRAPTMTDIDLAETTRTVADLMSVEAKRRGVRLSVGRTDGRIRVTGDHEQLQQVLINLLANALAATPKGGEVSLCLEIDECRRIADNAAAPCARVVVTDTGKGMTKETLDRLFEPFFTTRTDEGGTGLGLAVVKAIVGDHGGRVRAKSDLGLGSQFIVELPLPRPAAASVA